MGMVALEDSQGIFFCSVYEIASLAQDHPLRWRAVLRDGRVAHRPGPKPDGPWLALGEAWVLPQWLTRGQGGYFDPAGFFWPGPELQPVLPPAPGPVIEGLSCSMEQVLSAESRDRHTVWHTDSGEVVWKERLSRVAARFPSLIPVQKGLCINPNRLGRVQMARHNDSDVVELWSDSGVLLKRIFRRTHSEVAVRFGLPHFAYLEPVIPGMLRERLRDWPLELARAPGAFLKEHFDHPNLLMAHIIWQAVRRRQQGCPLDYDYEYRGFFYSAVMHTLYRAGFLSRGMTRRLMKAKRMWTENELWMMFQRVAAELVGQDRLFTFLELGFLDPAPYYRTIGTTRPEVVVLAEKTSEEPLLQQLRELYGVTTLVTGGQCRLLAVEHFLAALRKRVAGPIRVIAYVDYDPSGWQIAQAFVDMLLRYGVHLIQPLQILPREEHFTAEEIELFALPCPSEAPTESANWISAGGGIEGQPLCLHCNDLRPPERLLPVFEELLK